MYAVEVIKVSTREIVWPPVFTGAGEKYPKLIDAVKAAQDFIDKNFKNKEDYKVYYRIVGCL